MTYYAHSATLRILNAPNLHEEITRKTGMQPSHVHKEGEKKTPDEAWNNSVWMLESPLAAEVGISEHLQWLWQQIQPHVSYFKGLKACGVKLDIFCGFRTNTDTGGFRIEPSSLVIATELEIPIEVSVILV